MIDYQQIFHTGVLVADLDRAMAELGPGLDVTWATPQTVAAQRVWTPEGGADTWPLRFVYSVGGPQHIELLEGPPGTVWDGRANPGVHHQGVWVKSVTSETERLAAAGWQVVLAQLAPDDGYGSYAYVAPPSGMIIELVSSAVAPRFEAWWAGGSL